jgi:hypothetical protein
MFTKPLLLNDGGLYNKGSFQGEFDIRTLTESEYHGYHDSFAWGYEAYSNEDNGNFKIVSLGNQYWIDLRIYCDNSIMNLGEVTISDGPTTLVLNGQDLDFLDYGEGLSYYKIYAGSPGDAGFNIRRINSSITSRITLLISYEYDSEYIISGAQIKVVNVDNNVVYYTFRYAHQSKILGSVNFDLQYKNIYTQPLGGSVTIEWKSVASAGDTLYVNDTSCVYDANVTLNQDPSQTYAILATLRFSDNTTETIRSNEFQLNT